MAEQIGDMARLGPTSVAVLTVASHVNDGQRIEATCRTCLGNLPLKVVLIDLDG